MSQLDLQFTPILPEPEDTSIPARFARFHASNPHIYENLVKLARKFRSRGSNINRKMGIGMLYEVLRWNYFLTTDSDEEFKLSNDFRAPYARLIMAQEPDLSDAFNLRPSCTD